jgi:hypothetical protein
VFFSYFKVRLQQHFCGCSRRRQTKTIVYAPSDGDGMSERNLLSFNFHSFSSVVFFSGDSSSSERNYVNEIWFRTELNNSFCRAYSLCNFQHKNDIRDFMNHLHSVADSLCPLLCSLATVSSGHSESTNNSSMNCSVYCQSVCLH